LQSLSRDASRRGECPLSTVAPNADASFHTYQIDQIYSNADGTIQFVVLRETLGYPAEYYFSGHTFTSTQAGTIQTYTFMKDLPGASMGGYGGMMNSTAFTNVLIATAGFAALGLVTPDYVIPNGFLPLANGTINYAGVDQVSYASLPTDGASAVNRSGMIIQNVAANFAGDSASVTAAPPPSQTATAVEYYYASGISTSRRPSRTRSRRWTGARLAARGSAPARRSRCGRQRATRRRCRPVASSALRLHRRARTSIRRSPANACSGRPIRRPWPLGNSKPPPRFTSN